MNDPRAEMNVPADWLLSPIDWEPSKSFAKAPKGNILDRDVFFREDIVIVVYG